MLKRCPECSTSANPAAVYCDACGRIFDTPQVPSDLKVFMGALACSQS